jgi:hypothetical protein
LEKYTRFQDIPKFTRPGQDEYDYGIDSLWREVKAWVDNDGLDLNPDFQRGHVWTKTQQVNWLKFFLRGGKTGRVIYFNYPSWKYAAKTPYNDFVIVDGKQRLEAIRRFVEGEIKVYGSYFKEFTDSCRMHHTMRMNINDLQTRASVLNWYLQMNSGGVVHSGQELNRVGKLLMEELGREKS